MKLRLVILILFSLIIFSNSLFNKFVWVDHTQIVQEEHIIKGFDGFIDTFFSVMPGFSASVKGGYYRPIINLFHSIDYWIWGPNPFGFHLTNVLAHTLTGVVLYLVLLRVIAIEPVAFLASLFFLAHPIHTEAVSWISGRGDMVFALFYLLSFLFYLKAGSLGNNLSNPPLPPFSKGGNRKEGSRYRLYLYSGAFFLLALLSKEMALTLPLIIIFYDVCFRLRDKTFSLSRNFKVYVYYFGLLAGYMIFRILILGGIGSGQVIPGNNYFTAIYTTSRIFVWYIWKLIFPVSLAVADVVRLATSLTDPTVAGSIILLLLLLSAAVFLFRSHPELSFGILWFFITMIPVSNLVPALHFKAERYLYLPSIGYCLILAALLWKLHIFATRRWPSAKWGIVALASLISLTYGILTFDRNFDWKDDLTIFTDAVRKSPYTREAYAELGVTLREMKRYREAEAAFLAALREREGYAAFVQRIPMHQNLAEIYLETGQAPRAINHLLWLSRYYSNDYETQRDLGLAYLGIGRPDWALLKFRQALLTAPRDPRLMEVFQRAIKTAESSTVRDENTEWQKWVNLEMVNLDLAQARSALDRESSNF